MTKDNIRLKDKDKEIRGNNRRKEDILKDKDFLYKVQVIGNFNLVISIYMYILIF